MFSREPGLHTDLNLETDLFPLTVHFYKVFRHLNSFVQVFKMYTYLPIVRGYTHKRRGTGGFHGWWCSSLRPPQTWWTPSHPTHTHVTPLLTCTYSHNCFQTCSHINITTHTHTNYKEIMLVAALSDRLNLSHLVEHLSSLIGCPVEHRRIKLISESKHLAVYKIFSRHCDACLIRWIWCSMIPFRASVHIWQKVVKSKPKTCTIILKVAQFLHFHSQTHTHIFM